MSLKDQTVNLILRAKNFLTGDTDKAADSVDGLTKSAERLQSELRELEDNQGLVKQFSAAEKAVDRTSAAYDRARLRADKLADKIAKVGVPTQRQAQEFEAAQKAVNAAEREYKRAEKTLGDLAEEAHDAGINLEDLNGEQRRLAERAKEARRELEDLGNEAEKVDGRFLSFRKNLSSGIITFGKWAAAATAAGAALTVGALTRFTSSQAELARQTLASADAFGISAEKLQEWQYASDRVGISGEKTADIMKDVAEKIGDAFLTGGGEAADVIQGLNLDIEQLVRLRPDEQILAISERLNGLPKPAQIQILESLASDASLLLPLLENNAAKLRELSQEAQQRNAIFTVDELKKLAEVDSGFKRILAAVKGFGNELVVKLAPAFKDLAESIDEALTNKPKLVEDISNAFVVLIDKVRQFAEALGTDSSGINSSLSTIANTAVGLGNTFKAVFRGVQSFVAGALEVVARSAYSLQNIVVQVTRGLNAVGLATDESLAKAQAKLDVIGESVLDLQKQSENYKREMIQAGEAAATAFGKAKDGAVETVKATASAAGQMLALGSATEKTARTTEQFASEREKLIAKEGELGAAIELTAKAIDELGAAIAESPTDEQLAQLEALNSQYAEQRSQLKAVREELEKLDKPVNISVSTNVNSTSDEFRKATGAIDGATNSAKEFENSAEAAGEQVEQSGQQARSMGNAIADFYNTITSRLADLSQKALAAFGSLTGGSGEVISDLDVMRERVKSLGEGIRALSLSGVVAGSQLTKWFIDTAKASNQVEREFLKQKIALGELVDQFERGEYQSRYLNDSVEDLERQFNLLDYQDLSQLHGAISRVRAEVAGLQDSLEDTISSLRQELASLQGDTEGLEKLRYEEQRLELEQQLQRARTLGDRNAISAAQEALDLAQKAYNLRKEQAKERSREEAERVAQQAAEVERQRQQAEAQQREQEQQDYLREQRQTQQPSGRTTTVILQGPTGQQIPVQTDNEAGLLDLLESLGRRVS